MKIIIPLILSVFFLTSCSNPGTSGGVTLSRSNWGDAAPQRKCERERDNVCMNLSNDGKRYEVAPPPPPPEEPPPRTASFFVFMSAMR